MSQKINSPPPPTLARKKKIWSTEKESPCFLHTFTFQTNIPHPMSDYGGLGIVLEETENSISNLSNQLKQQLLQNVLVYLHHDNQVSLVYPKPFPKSHHHQLLYTTHHQQLQV